MHTGDLVDQIRSRNGIPGRKDVIDDWHSNANQKAGGLPPMLRRSFYLRRQAGRAQTPRALFKLSLGSFRGCHTCIAASFIKCGVFAQCANLNARLAFTRDPASRRMLLPGKPRSSQAHISLQHSSLRAVFLIVIAPAVCAIAWMQVPFFFVTPRFGVGVGVVKGFYCSVF